MRRFCLLFLLFLVNFSLFAQKITPSLRAEMDNRADNEMIDVFVIMEPQYDRAMLGMRASSFASRADRREYVVNELKSFAETTQSDLRKSLDNMQKRGTTTAPTVLWMSNSMFFSATKQAIDELAGRKDIAAIGLNKEEYMLFADDEAIPASNTREITQNVTQVRADEVWASGYTGAGVIVAVIDTGVNYDHLDLADHLWDGGEDYPHHGWDFINNDNDPRDDQGHGTHCAGTICGDGTAGSLTGMAPDATLMIVKCLNNKGNGSIVGCMQAMEWAVEHGCDIISMSLGGHVTDTYTLELCRSTCEAVMSAGVVAAIAAGNEGDELDEYPIPNNIGVPGACPPPYLDPTQSLNPGGLSCSVCVGAVNYNDEPTTFTSVGPFTWAGTSYADYPYTPGSVLDFGLIRPDVCAPGYQIKSAYYGNNTGYVYKNGTSMATPCVAGCMALIMQKNPDITPTEMCKLLEETAVPLSETKSNYTGVGRIDVMEAIDNMPMGSLKLNSCIVADEAQGNGDHLLNPGETVSLNVSLQNTSEEPVNGASLVLSTESAHVTITNTTTQLPIIAGNQTVEMEDVFTISIDNDAVPGNVAVFKGEVKIGGETIGVITFSLPVYDYKLGYKNIAILNDDNGNGSLEPGETADMRVYIDNGGNVTANSITGLLTAEYAYLTLNETEKSFGDIAASSNAYADFSVTLASEAPQAYDISLSIALTDAYGKVTTIDFNHKKYAVAIETNMDDAGTIAGAGYYDHGTICTLVATPNEDYLFENWTYGSEIVGTKKVLSFEVTGAVTLKANFVAVNGIYIGEGEEIAYALPSTTSGYYKYAMSEQIYSAAEIGQAGYINSIAFYNDGYDQDAIFDIYLKHTTKTVFDSSDDWVAVEASDKVYSGAFEFLRGFWIVIELDTPFAYDGTSNLLLVVDDNSGYSGPSFGRAFDTDGCQAMYCGSDTDVNPSNPSGNYGIREYMKNQIILDIVNADDTFTVSVASNDNEGGTVSGGGTFVFNTSCTVVATPQTDYTFLYWTENDDVVSTDPSYTFNVRSDRNLTAWFYSTAPIVFADNYVKNICVSHWDANDDGELSYAEAVVITDIGSYFWMNWNVTSFDELQYFTGLKEIKSNAFSSCYYLESLIIPSSVTSIGDYAFGRCTGLTSLGVKALTPPALGQDVFYNDDLLNIAVTVYCESASLYNNTPGWDEFVGYQTFDDCSQTVTVAANPMEGGSVSGGGEFNTGTSCTLVATPNEGWLFTCWTRNGTMASFNATYTFDVSIGASEYVANFILIDGTYIGNGEEVNEYLPGSSYYKYALSEQIYTADEIGAGEINSIAFFNTDDEQTRDYSIYIKATEKSAFSNGHDWVEVDESDLVFSGYVTMTKGTWTKITFDTPFYSDGNSNIVLAVDDNTGAYTKNMKCRVFATNNNQAVYVYSDNTNYDPLNQPTYNGSLLSVKNQIILGKTTSTQTTSLIQGWNWYSTYIEQNDVDGLTMLENSLGDAGIRIQGRNGYTEQFEYQGTKTWYGTLTSITNEQMYKIRTNAACNAVMTGAAANPADHPITINSGWNWIGLPLSESASVASAMSDFTPEANDVIKGRNGAATYIVYGNTSMWYGTMNTLEPGQGYMYQSNSTTPKTLTFNSSREESSPSVLSDISVISTLYDLSSISSYSDNMLVTAVIEINGEELRSSNYELAAFVDNECRGSVKLMYVEPLDRYLAMLLVFGDEPEDVHFVLTDGTEIRTSNDKVVYTSDATIGTASSPTTLHFETIATNHDVKVYPNPSNDVFNISCEGLKQLELLNIYGQVIMMETVNENNHQIDLTDYPSGAYMLRIITDNGVVLKKLVKNQ